MFTPGKYMLTVFKVKKVKKKEILGGRRTSVIDVGKLSILIYK
jgi:hypothetical protein